MTNQEKSENTQKNSEKFGENMKKAYFSRAHLQIKFNFNNRVGWNKRVGR